jgi:hypothetical protein
VIKIFRSFSCSPFYCLFNPEFFSSPLFVIGLTVLFTHDLDLGREHPSHLGNLAYSLELRAIFVIFKYTLYIFTFLLFFTLGVCILLRV